MILFASLKVLSFSLGYCRAVSKHISLENTRDVSVGACTTVPGLFMVINDNFRMDAC